VPLWNFVKTNHIVHYSSLIQPKRPSHPNYYMPSATVLHRRYGLDSVSRTGKWRQTLHRLIMPPKSTVWFHMVGETLTFRICRGLVLVSDTRAAALTVAWHRNSPCLWGKGNASYHSIVWRKFSYPVVVTKPPENGIYVVKRISFVLTNNPPFVTIKGHQSVQTVPTCLPELGRLVKQQRRS
jgi:hypothetical protein